MKREICPLHGEKQWVECWNCEDGYSHHECGDDCCACFQPKPNVRCDICNGKGGHYVCLTCHPEVAEDIYG